MKIFTPVAGLRNISLSSLLFLFLLCFGVWASMFEIDQSVRTQGQIISKVRTQIIQAADGGVLSELFVSEGQEVEAGQVLAVLERGRAEAAYAESRAKSSALSIALSRANAESRLEVPVWSFESDGYSNFVQVQQKLCRQRGSIPASKSYQGVT